MATAISEAPLSPNQHNICKAKLAPRSLNISLNDINTSRTKEASSIQDGEDNNSSKNDNSAIMSTKTKSNN